VFITFNVAGSLPTAVEKELKRQALLLKNDMTGDPLSLAIAWKKLFKYADDKLDLSDRCLHLKEPAAAQIVIESIHKGVELKHYRLHRYCIMPNHVHLLIEPLILDSSIISVEGPPVWPPLFYTDEGRQLLCGGRAPEEIKWYTIERILQPMKASTGRLINKLRGVSGTFWNQESYDHWIRNGEEYCRVISYIDNNPVKAGLCREASHWKWSSAYRP